MGGSDLVRSRRLIVAGFVVAFACMVALLWPAGGLSMWLRYGGIALVVLAADGVALYGQLRAKTLAARRAVPVRFVETDRGLAAAAAHSYAYAAILQTLGMVLVVGNFLTALRAGYDDDPATRTVELVFTAVATALVTLCAVAASSVVVFAWRGVAVELTPVGVRTIGPRFDRLIPWQSLAYGGPPRPALTADWLVLVAARPELIMQRGWDLGPIGWGPRHHPKVALAANVHPWLLADAIRWYVEHPTARDALGTPGEQDRLIAALSGAPQPPLPATWR